MQIESIKRFIISVSYVTIGTILGRMAGFLKHFLVVKYFGLSFDSDGFFIANTISEMAVNILIYGILTGALVPLASEIFVKYGNKKFAEFVSMCFYIFAGLLFIVSISVFFLSKQIAVFIAPSYTVEQHSLISNLLKVISPGFIFLGIAAVLMSILQAKEKFLLPSLGFFAANLTVVIVTIGFHREIGIYAPAIGNSSGFFVWFLMLVPSTLKYLNIKIIFDPFYAKKLTKVVVPSLLIIFIANLVLIIEKIVASQFPEGTISQLNLALRLSTLFASVLILPISTVLLPKFSKKYSKKEFDSLYNLLKKSLKIVSIVLFTFLLFVLYNSALLTKLFYGLTGASQQALMFIANFTILYSLAYLGQFYYILLLKLFFSFQKPNQILFANILGIIFYIAGINFLIKYLGFYVLPLAYALNYIVSTLYLFVFLKNKIFTSRKKIMDSSLFGNGMLFILAAILLKYFLPDIGNNMLLNLILSGIMLLGFFFVLYKTKSLKVLNILTNK